MSFKDLFINCDNINIILKKIKKDFNFNSLLFTGESSSGKLRLSISLAKALNCENKEGDFCNNCNSCKSISNLSSSYCHIINMDNLSYKLNILNSYYKKKPSIFIFSQLKEYLKQLQSKIYHLLSKTNYNKYIEKLENILNNKLLIKLENSTNISQSDLKNLSKILKQSYDLESSIFKTNNISIDCVRNMHKLAYIKPDSSKFRCFIINGAECFSNEAANALLKLVEDPPFNTVFILISENMENILKTLKSRCFNFLFRPFSINQKKDIILDKYKINIDIDSINEDSFWDILESNLYDVSLINLFLKECYLYPFSETFFEFVDQLSKPDVIFSFSKDLFKYFSKFYYYRYGLYPKNIYLFSCVPNIVIDEILDLTENIVTYAKSFNLNMNIIVSSYLINIFEICLPYLEYYKNIDYNRL